AFKRAYKQLGEQQNDLNLLLTTYFEGLGDNRELACSLPVDGLHIDLVEAPNQLDEVLDSLKEDTTLSLGLIDGRNIWKTDLDEAAQIIQKAADQLGPDRLMLAPSCSLLHSPVDLNQENNPDALPNEVKRWMAF